MNEWWKPSVASPPRTSTRQCLESLSLWTTTGRPLIQGIIGSNGWKKKKSMCCYLYKLVEGNNKYLIKKQRIMSVLWIRACWAWDLYLEFYQVTFLLCYLSHGIASRAESEKCLIKDLKPSCRLACDFSHSIVCLYSLGQVTYILLALVSSTIKVVGNTFLGVLLSQPVNTVSSVPS